MEKEDLKKAYILYEERRIVNQPIGSQGETLVLDMCYIQKKIQYPLLRVNLYFWKHVLSEETKFRLQEELRKGIMEE